MYFVVENVWILIKISLKFVPKGPINNSPALVQIMAWHRPGDKPLYEPMMANLLMHLSLTQPQWVKANEFILSNACLVYRKRLVLQNDLDPYDDLKLCSLVLTRHPKSAETFIQRYDEEIEMVWERLFWLYKAGSILYRHLLELLKTRCTKTVMVWLLWIIFITKHGWVPLWHSPIYHVITYGTVMTAAEHRPDIKFTGKLWGVCCENIGLTMV